MSKETTITSAEVTFEDDNTKVISWGGNHGFGELTFKHTEGCTIEVDAECMSIDTIFKIFERLNNNVTLTERHIEPEEMKVDFEVVRVMDDTVQVMDDMAEDELIDYDGTMLNSKIPTKELCVSCGIETQYDRRENINNRSNYIRGMGQLCYICGHGEELSNITIHSNDLEMVQGENKRLNDYYEIEKHQTEQSWVIKKIK